MIFCIKREATKDEDKNKWIFFQQGGGWCYDDLTCLERIAMNLIHSDLISSKHWKDHKFLSGIFDMVCENSGIFVICLIKLNIMQSK